MKESSVTFVDLAGSECQKATKASGITQLEAAINNKSLLAFGRVITALAEGEKKIPYRDSTLTELLSNSLSINSMVRCTSCSSYLC